MFSWPDSDFSIQKSALQRMRSACANAVEFTMDRADPRMQTCAVKREGSHSLYGTRIVTAQVQRHRVNRDGCQIHGQIATAAQAQSNFVNDG